MLWIRRGMSLGHARDLSESSCDRLGVIISIPGSSEAGYDLLRSMEVVDVEYGPDGLCDSPVRDPFAAREAATGDDMRGSLHPPDRRTPR